MSIDITLHDTSDIKLTDPVTVTAQGGETSAAETVRLYNGFASTADPAVNVQVLAWAVPAESPGAAPEPDGQPVVDRYMVEARVSAGLGGLTIPTGQWVRLGPGTSLELPTLGDGQGVSIELRLSPPAGAGAAAYTVYLTAVDDSTAVTDGPWRVAGQGIHLPIGDGATSLVIEAADVVENPAAADNQVQAGPAVYLDGEGRPRSVVAALETLAASSAGNSRYDLLSLGASGVTVTTGTESGAALTDDDKPATPAGEEPYAYVLVDDTGVIQDADIEQAATASLYAVTAGGASATVAPGSHALVGGFVTYNLVSQTVDLADDVTNQVWLLATGEIGVTSTAGDVPALPGELLAEVDVASGAVTATRDRRRFLGARLAVVRLEWLGTLAAGTFRYAINPFDRDAYILPVRGLRATVGATGAASGATTFGLSAGDLAGGWTDLVGTDRPPSIAFDATDPRDLDGRPQDYLVPAGARLRGEVVAIPGTASEDGILEVILWAA